MKFERPNSNIVPFGTNANENKRFAFGTNNYTNDINENLNDSFKLGWETVGINSKPPRQWFNGLAYTSTYLTSYLFQTGIPEWNDKQKYYINSIAMGSDGNIYRSLVGTEETPNVNNNPTLAGSVSWKSILSDYALINGDETKKFKVATPEGDYDAVNKKYVDNLKIIATGTATFNSTTNNINLTGIGIGVEIGDVIQISGADDTKNNSEFTVEVIIDNDNIIVNQAHANKGESKNVVNRSRDTGVTVKLLAKWYNAPLGLGQGWVNVTRTINVNYQNTTNRTIITTLIFSYSSGPSTGNVVVNDVIVDTITQVNVATYQYKCNVPKDGIYNFVVPATGTVSTTSELR